MNPRFFLIILLLAALPLTPAGPAHAAADTAELARLLNEFLAGASVNDTAAHERFWADDLVYTSSGEPGGVTQYLNTGTFQKSDGEWKAVAWQATRIPDPD